MLDSFISNWKLMLFEMEWAIYIDIASKLAIIKKITTYFVDCTNVVYSILYLFFFSILHSILIRTNGGNTLHTLKYLVEANQLGLKSSNPKICSLSNVSCLKSDLQQRTLCGIIKPICPVLKFSCRLCKFYLSTKCRKTCQTYENFCGNSGCSNSSTISLSRPNEPAVETTLDGM